MTEMLSADQAGFPQFDVKLEPVGHAFDLSSHERAREALAMGLDTPGTEYNVFVLGPDGAGRMTSTRHFIQSWVKKYPASEDWVYVIDFDTPNRPLPIALPAGVGRKLKATVAELIPTLARELKSAFSSETYQQQVTEVRSRGEARVQKRIQELDGLAQSKGLSILNTPQGAVIAVKGEDGQIRPINMLPLDERNKLEQQAEEVMRQMGEVNREAAVFQQEFYSSIKNLNREVASRAVDGFLRGLAQRFESYVMLEDWLKGLREDIIGHYEIFLSNEGGLISEQTELAGRRYFVNLMADRTFESSPSVIVEQNPTYENLFGRIEYRQLPGGALDTDASLIRPGALHQANGGVLVLRAEALVAQPLLWAFLKAALRDGEIRIEEFYRANMPPITGAPKPIPIPLELNVVIVGSPQWYYGFFALDPEFHLYFKIKAEIEPDVDVTAENLACYSGILSMSAKQKDIVFDLSALVRVLGMASRWAQHRRKLTSGYEIAMDLIFEASQQNPTQEPLSEKDINRTLEARRRRKSQIEDRVQKAIQEGLTLIEVSGTEVGQINGLTVRTIGDHTFGTPSRITARSSVGRRGVINIERLVAMSGPIQQKASLVLQGLMMRRFGRMFPLSFDCSVTFEQMYGGVEGDSASLAEYIALISDLADVPIRQDIAITGSVNQLGDAQVIGGAHYKVEGFFQTCCSAGELTGTQGVVIPALNAVNLVLRDEVRDAIAAETFHVWKVNRVEEALEIFTGMPAGEAELDDGETVYGRVFQTLQSFDEILKQRGI